MKRIFISTFTLSLVAAVVMAIPAKRGQWKTLRLGNGTEVRAELVGDEFGHYYRTADGQCFVKDYSAVDAAETYTAADVQAIVKTAAESRASVQSAQTTLMKAPQKITIGGNHDNFEGVKKGLIILVQFSDKKFADGHDQALYKRIVNEENFSYGNFKGSVRDYYYAQSGGKFTMNFDVVGPVTMPKDYAYYGKDYNENVHDMNVRTMIRTALTSVDADVNFADYDWDGDGVVEQVFIVYAGMGQASGGDDNTIWPHMSQLGSFYALRLDGVTLNTYACSNELNYNGEIDGIGAFCHEFSHCMGLPDMYDTSYGGNFGMSAWDVMDQGCYNGNSFLPCSYTAYEKMYCGWQTPEELVDGMEVKNMAAINEGGLTYVIYNSGNKNEYYLFENRKQTGWDAGLYGSGLLVTHIDFNSSIWANNLVNTTSAGSNDHQRCTILHADGNETETQAGLAGDAYPYSYNKNITKATSPKMDLYTADANGNTVMDLAILDITKSDDGSISFNVKDNDKIGEDKRPDGALFYESFDLCSGTGGNDGLWTGTAATFIPDNDGWASSLKYGGDKCARFGSNTQRGSATTPEITIDGSYELSFKAAPYTGEATSLSLTLSNTDMTLSEKSFTLTANQWTDYKVTIAGSGTTTINFRSDKRRFFLDEVAVAPPSAGINGVTIDPATLGKQRIYTIDGRYVGTSLNALKRGVYIVGGKKVVK